MRSVLYCESPGAASCFQDREEHKRDHQFKNNGYNIVMDVCSGAVHVVDDVVYDVISVYEKEGREGVLKALSGKYPDGDLEEALQETEELKKRGSFLRRTPIKIISLISRAERPWSRPCASMWPTTAT